MSTLPFSLERTVVIRARRETVFTFFTDSARFAQWWGPGSLIEPRAGGKVLIRYPNAVEASGNVVEIDDGRKIVFTYGYASGKPIGPGASRVTITLEEIREGTRVRLQHDVPDAATRDSHVQGWRYQMAVFANAAAAIEHASAAERVDALFKAWSESDAAARELLLSEAVAPAVSFHDKFSATDGLADLHAHLAAAQMHMPGVKITRDGAVQQCQGTAVARWIASGPNGAELGRGTNVYEFAPDGRIAKVIGFWG